MIQSSCNQLHSLHHNKKVFNHKHAEHKGFWWHKILESGFCSLSTVYKANPFHFEWPPLLQLIKTFRQWLFWCWQHFSLGDYFAVSYLWLVNLNDILNMWLLAVSDGSILIIKKNLHPHTVHYPIHSHTGPHLQCTLPFFKCHASQDSNL